MSRKNITSSLPQEQIKYIWLCEHGKWCAPVTSVPFNSKKITQITFSEKGGDDLAIELSSDPAAEGAAKTVNFIREMTYASIFALAGNGNNNSTRFTVQAGQTVDLTLVQSLFSTLDQGTKRERIISALSELQTQSEEQHGLLWSIARVAYIGPDESDSDAAKLWDNAIERWVDMAKFPERTRSFNEMFLPAMQQGIEIYISAFSDLVTGRNLVMKSASNAPSALVTLTTSLL